MPMVISERTYMLRKMQLEEQRDRRLELWLKADSLDVSPTMKNRMEVLADLAEQNLIHFINQYTY